MAHNSHKWLTVPNLSGLSVKIHGAKPTLTGPVEVAKIKHTKKNPLLNIQSPGRFALPECIKQKPQAAVPSKKHEF